MEFFNSLQQVKDNWKPYQNWEKKQDNKEFQRQELNKEVPTSKTDLEHAAQYGRTLIDSINTMDQYSINKAEDVEMASQLVQSSVCGYIGLAQIALFGLLRHKSPKFRNYMKNLEKTPQKFAFVMGLASMAPMLTIMPIIKVKFASYEKEASRIARYHAREEDLKDPQNFVVYNEAQIAEAKKIAKDLPAPADKEKKKNHLNPFANYKDSYASVKSLINEHNDYLQWKQKNLKEEKNKQKEISNAQFSPQQLQNAKKDQDNLLRIIRKIEISSQNYLSNVEMACNTVLTGDAVIGVLAGGIVSGFTHLLQKTKLVSKKSLVAGFIKTFAPIVTPVALLLATTSYSIKIQKEAAKIGRFKAKQELLNDPHNFITYSDEQMNSVKDLKAPNKEKKGFCAKFKDDVKFFFTLKKDYKEYENYQKTEYKEEQKLQKALKSIKITDEQARNAKSLQKNAFMSFEKMDEMTQRYVDDTDAAADIGKQYINSAYNLIGTAISLFLMSKKSVASSETKVMIANMAPAFAPLLFQIPIEAKANQIKKEAGKIGTMKAMQDLENPAMFVN